MLTSLSLLPSLEFSFLVSPNTHVVVLIDAALAEAPGEGFSALNIDATLGNTAATGLP